MLNLNYHDLVLNLYELGYKNISNELLKLKKKRIRKKNIIPIFFEQTKLDNPFQILINHYFNNFKINEYEKTKINDKIISEFLNCKSFLELIPLFQTHFGINIKNEVIFKKKKLQKSKLNLLLNNFKIIQNSFIVLFKFNSNITYFIDEDSLKIFLIEIIKNINSLNILFNKINWFLDYYI